MNHEVSLYQVTEAGRWPCEMSEALVRYLAIPTVRLTFSGLHQMRTRRSASADGTNSTCREKSGGCGNGVV